MKKTKIISLSLSILFFFCFTAIIALEEIPEIELDKDEKIVDISEENNSKLIYVTGDISQDKKYILISLISDILFPSISITKKEDFDKYKDEYDYTLLPKEKKLALPSSYFNSKDINGFYIIISWENEYKNFSLKFEYIDEINLDLEEEFSFFSKYENVQDFQINVINSTGIGNIGFILSGGDEKQISMTINGNETKKMINNVFYFWMPNELEIYTVKINVSKNVKFFFKTIIFNEVNENSLQENKFNQFFFVKHNIEECFIFESIEEGNENDLIIVSQDKFMINIYGEDYFNANYEYTFKNSEPYAISDNLKLNETMKKVCIQLNKENSDDFSLIQIYYYNKIKTISEPLISGISYNFILPSKNASQSLNQHINIHTHSQFFERYSEMSEMVGTNVIIKSISGKMKIYQDLCNTYPYCEFNNNSRFRKEVYSLNGYYHILLKASEDFYYESNKQNIFIAVCEEEVNECRYEILFSDNQKKTFIRSGDTVSKFLEPYNNKIQDLYFTSLHSLGNKIIVNLVVYSGDAYLVQINDIKGCKFEEEHFGSDERRIFHCDENEMNEYYTSNEYIEIKIEFSIRSGKKGAIYSLFVIEQAKDNEDIFIPIEMAKFDIIKNSNKYKLIKKQNEINDIITLINPINCNINLTDENDDNYYSYQNNYIQYSTSLENKAFTDLILTNSNNFNNINKCLFYLSSYSQSNEDSFLIITENKHLKFNLNRQFNNTRMQYLFGMINGIKKIYLKVDTIGNCPLKIKIINTKEENSNEYIVKDSKIITIMNNNKIGLPLNSLLKLKIYVSLNSGNLYNKKASVSLKIISDGDPPTFLKHSEQLSDMLINDENKYFIYLVNKGSSGNYYINLNNNNIGKIYGRLLDSDHIKEQGGWNNRFILPDNGMDNNKLLPFDFENQRLILEKEHTQFCNKYCYLLIGINLFSFNYDISKNIITRFNSYLELIEDTKDDSKNMEKKFIKLINNEHTSGFVTDDKSDLFCFKLDDNNSKLNINFYCDNCMISVVFNDTNFDSNETQKFISNGGYEEILLGKDKNITNLTAYIKINTLNNENSNKSSNNIKYKYSFKLNSPNDEQESLKYTDGSMPETLKFDSNSKYYDYAIKLDSYNSDKDINIIAVPNTDNNDNNSKNIKNKIEIYANIIDDNQTIIDWPNKNRHHFPKKWQSPSEFLKIKKTDILDNNENKIMLIRVYGKENNTINLYTNYDNIDEEEEKEKDLIIPGTYQLITVNNSKSNSYLNIKPPLNLDKNKDYIYKIKRLNGKGKIVYGDDTYELNDRYDSISFPLDQNLPLENNQIQIKSKNTNKSNNYNESLTFLIKYEEKNKFNSLEKIKLGDSKSFTSKDDTEPIDYFIPLENIESDLPININFDSLNSNEEDEYKNQIRNNVESFDIKGYLITEEELNNIKDGNISFIEDKKDFKKGNFYLENNHGFLNINKNEIDNFKKNNNNTKPYLYLTMKKSKENDKKYEKIKGNINIYPPNYTEFPVPEDSYNYNSINCTQKNKHKYKLGDIIKNTEEGISNDTHNLIIDFSSPIKGLKVKIVKNNSDEEDLDYFGINKIENNNGKDTINISKNIENAYLLVETPDDLLNKTDGNDNTNVDYMFKYFYVDKTKDKESITNIKYNNTLIYNKMDSSECKTNITLNKLKDSKDKQIKCNYYIRLYKNIKKESNKNNNYRKKNISLINNNDDNNLYAIYKIDSDNPILKNDKEDQFTIPIEIDIEEPVFVDVVAQNVENGEIYGYSKAYPNSDFEYEEEEENNKNNDGENKDKDKDKDKDKESNGGLSIVKLILIFICALLLIILLIICCMKTCSCSCFCCRKKDSDELSTVLPGLKDITFHTTEDEGDNNFTISSLN